MCLLLIMPIDHAKAQTLGINGYKHKLKPVLAG